MLRETETVEFKKSTAELKAGVASIAADQVDTLKTVPDSAARVSVAGDQSSVNPVSEFSADEILQKVENNYRNMKSYYSEGMTKDSITMAGMSQKMSATFSIRLAKPNLYKVSWHDSMPNLPVQTGGVLWNVGVGPNLLMAGRNQKMTSDKMAMAGAAGVSHGATGLIPNLFLDIGTYPFKQVKDAKVIGSETVDGQACYIVKGSNAFTTDERYWISKDKYLIVRHSYKSDVNQAVPEMSDGQMAETLKAMGMEINEENKAKVKQMMGMAKSMRSQVQGGDHQVDYRNIVIDADIARGEFDQVVPQGISQEPTRDAMGDVFNHLNEMKASMDSQKLPDGK